MDRIYLPQLLPLEEYEKIIVLFSGGKDSLACVLDLLERGVPRERIELWHHDIDGGHPDRKMDWPVTQAYVRAVSEYLGLVLRTSWRVNGFWGEVYRMGASWPIQYTEPDSGIVRERKLSEKQIRSAQLREAVLSSVEQAKLEQMGRRMKFPAKSGNLATRWCSSILKIEKHFLGMWSKNVYNAAERAKSAIISSKSSNTLHRTLNFTPSLHQMKKTSDVVFKFLTNRKK